MTWLAAYTTPQGVRVGFRTDEWTQAVSWLSNMILVSNGDGWRDAMTSLNHARHAAAFTAARALVTCGGLCYIIPSIPKSP